MSRKLQGNISLTALDRADLKMLYNDMDHIREARSRAPKGQFQVSKTSKHDMKSTAKLIAMFVRYGIEGFHREHLTNEQMRILNPLIRNAIYSALYAIEHAEEEWHCDQQLERMRSAVPSYWEPPVVWDSLTEKPEYDEEATRHFKRLHAQKYGLPAEEE